MTGKYLQADGSDIGGKRTRSSICKGFLSSTSNLSTGKVDHT